MHGPINIRNIPAFNGIRRFITVLTTARHLSLSRTKIILSTPSHTIPVRYPLYYYRPTYGSVFLAVSHRRSVRIYLEWQIPVHEEAFALCYAGSDIWRAGKQVTRKQDGAAVSDIPILNKNRHPWLLRWQGTEHQSYADTDTDTEIIQRPLAVTGRSLHTACTTFSYIQQCYCLTCASV